MIPEFNDTKELFDYVRKYDLNQTKSLAKIFDNYNFQKVQIRELLNEITNTDNSLLIDSRSEKEFEESAIPNAINFPILTTSERHNVGIIYKNYSSVAAGKLAMEYADHKLDKLQIFLNENKGSQKNIYVHCWRGGGRSKYLAKLLVDAGYNMKILEGGFKSYRKIVNEFFNQAEFPYEIVELNGLTGVGKTELINFLKNDIPVIDLEKSARHFSSLFGFVPYKIRNFKPVSHQSAFENDIYSQINKYKNKTDFNYQFLIESESKKVGDFFIPQILYQKMLEAPSINIIVNIEVRINRIINDYFGTNNSGLKEMLNILNLKERFFRKELSNVLYNDAKSNLEKGNVYDFTKLMIMHYYDKKYKDKCKIPIATVNNDNIEKAKEEVLYIIRNFKKR